MNDEQTIPADRRSTTKRRSKSGSSSSASSSHKMETASSDDMQSSDEGSEFGEYDTLREHQRRLPQIRRDMANILNLKVRFFSFSRELKFITLYMIFAFLGSRAFDW